MLVMQGFYIVHVEHSIGAGFSTSQCIELPELVCKLWKSCTHHRQMEYKGIQKDNIQDCGKGRSLLNCSPTKIANTHTHTESSPESHTRRLFCYFWVLLFLFFFPWGLLATGRGGNRSKRTCLKAAATLSEN